MKWLLSSKPYEIQQISYDKSCGRDRFGYFLEQGMGKTPLNFADFLRLIEDDEVDCNIVIAPSYLKSGWAGEAELHDVGWPTITWPDKVSERQLSKPFIFVINTEAMLHSGGRYVDDLLKTHRALLTVDESVCIGNFNSQISKKVIILGSRLKYRRALSGLPTPENVMQWWPQLRFCGGINGINPYSFRNRYAIMGGYMGKKVTGMRNEEELMRIVDECGIRALKDDWLDLPPKVLMPMVTFDMTSAQQRAYKTMEEDFMVETGGNEEVLANAVIHQLMKLQQISRGFILDGETEHELVDPSRNPAIETLKELLATVRGKAMVFTYYKYSTRTVFEQLYHAGFEPIVLRGGLTTQEIAERKKQFNTDDACRVAVMQLTVGAKGHTMLGSPRARCATSIYYENVYSRDIRSQSEDRNHRIGQDQSVNYFDLCENAKRPVTIKALNALRKKQSFIDATLNAIRTTR